METLLKHAAIAWNPIGETRRRLHEGNLTLSAVLLPFLAVVIGCNLVAGAAQMFFFESLMYGLGEEMPEHPLLGDFAQRFLSAIGVLIPLAVVALLPSRIFAPVGRGATLASILVIAAAWAFYGAAISIPVYFIAGVLATADPVLGFTVHNLLMVPGSLLIVGLLIWFWFRVLRGVLELASAAFALIAISTLGTLAAIAAMFWVLLYP